MPIVERQGKNLFMCEQCPAIAVIDFDTRPKNWIGCRCTVNMMTDHETVLCPECAQTHIICDACQCPVLRIEEDNEAEKCKRCGHESFVRPVPDPSTRTQQAPLQLKEAENYTKFMLENNPRLSTSTKTL